jgi:ABC-type transport system substrate-binding protein
VAYDPETGYGWELADVNFRHALAHSFDQIRIVDVVYGYTAAPVHSLVPPTQGNWSNPNVETHPFNLNGVGMGYPGAPIPGDPDDLTAATTILWNAGYRYHGTGVGDANAYWTYPRTWPVRPDTGDRRVHHFVLWTPTYWVELSSKDLIGQMFVDDLARIGLKQSDANGNSGFEHVPYEFSEYIRMVYGDPLADPPVPGADFDAYITNFKLNRFPDYLYDWLHSSQDSMLYPGRYNAFGINDTVLDELVETVKCSFDHFEKNNAAWLAQELLSDPERPCGLPAIPVYTMTYYNAFNPDLRGIVKSYGFGSDGGGCVALEEPDGPTTSIWTYMNIRWEPGTARALNWGLADYPESFNPLYAGTVASWETLDRVYDPLMMVNPYTHAILPWLAEDWEVVETPGGPGAMNVTFQLRKDVFWQDGTPYTAWDAKWNWMFLKNNEIPKYAPTWKFIQDVDVINDYTVTIIANATSQFLKYDFASTAALMPPVVWRHLDGQPLATIMSFAPEQETDPISYTEPIPGYPDWFAMSNGTWFGDGNVGHPQTHLYGTGPWVYGSYVGGVATFERFINYYRTTESLQDQLATMFHDIGDVGQDPDPGPWYEPDGIIDVWDITYLTWNYGYFGICPGPFCEWPENVIQADGEYGDRYIVTDVGYRDWLDINHDKMIDMWDLSSAGYYQNQQKEYP